MADNEKCQRCKSARVAAIGGKCSDMFWASIGKFECQDYVAEDMNIGGDDYIEFALCLECGQIQGEWPLPKTKLESGGYK